MSFYHENLTVSCISHNQSELLINLLQDLSYFSPNLHIKITENTLNTPSIFPFKSTLQIELHNNPKPLGFGENHNQNFKKTNSHFFCIVNPDIQLVNNPFPELLSLFNDPSIGVVAPIILNGDRIEEDNLRYFPTFFGLTRKLLLNEKGRFKTNKDKPHCIDWAAGMFLVFRSEAFYDVGGFDEKFFMYYEDADICTRLWKKGWKVVAEPKVQVIHHAQRTSHKNFRFLRWHLLSMARYLFKHTGHLPKISSI